MERKSLTAEIKQLDEQGRGEARIATLQVRDLDGDVLMVGVLGGEQVVPLVPGHQWHDAPLGKARVREQGRELIAGFQLNMKLGQSRAWYEALKFDLETPPPRQAWSFAFRIPEGGAERGTFEGQPVRFLRRLQLLEVSPVLAAASVNTATLALKGDLAQDQETLAAMEARVRSMTLSPEPADMAALAASVKATLARGAELLAKLAGQTSYRYVEMLDWNLQAPQRHLAREALFFASKELGISPPALKFFTSTDPERAEFVSEKMWGYSRKGDHIAIEWTLSPAEMTQVVAHEVGHAAGLGEAEAEAFGKQFAARHGTQFGPAPRRSGGFTAEQLGAIAQVIKSGLPIPR